MTFLYSSILVLHIAGALVSALAGMYALSVLMQHTTSRFSRAALALAGLATFQTVTGSLLALTSSDVTAVSLCANLVAYVTPMALLEVVLCLRMIQTQQLFPVTRVVYPMLASSVAFGALVAFGV